MRKNLMARYKNQSNAVTYRGNTKDHKGRVTLEALAESISKSLEEEKKNKSM